jgi:hypothetical protein
LSVVVDVLVMVARFALLVNIESPVVVIQKLAKIVPLASLKKIPAPRPAFLVFLEQATA